MQQALQQVNYTRFRQLLSEAAGQKIRNKGMKTYVYDRNNHVLAVLLPAAIDRKGRTRQPQYFIRSAA